MEANPGKIRGRRRRMPRLCRHGARCPNHLLDLRRSAIGEFDVFAATVLRIERISDEASFEQPLDSAQCRSDRALKGRPMVCVARMQVFERGSGGLPAAVRINDHYVDILAEVKQPYRALRTADPGWWRPPSDLPGLTPAP